MHRATSLSQQQPVLGWGSSKPPLPARYPQGQRRGKDASFVPDHVRHPEKYTMYELEEPLVVGSGDFRAADSQPQKARLSHMSIKSSADLDKKIWKILSDSFILALHNLLV